mgnify:CR=1 FL=1
MRILSYQLSMSLNSQNFLKMYSRFLGNTTFVLCCNEQKKSISIFLTFISQLTSLKNHVRSSRLNIRPSVS